MSPPLLPTAMGPGDERAWGPVECVFTIIVALPNRNSYQTWLCGLVLPCRTSSAFGTKSLKCSF